MGMSREEKQIFASLQAQLAAMQNPASSPAQQALTDQALAGSQYFQKGDYSTLPKGMFFDFQQPTDQINQYKKLTNVGQGGTFALANNGNVGGRTAATANAGQYLNDKFARDAEQNYQTNISNASNRVVSGLQEAGSAKSQNDSAILSALSSMYNKPHQSSGILSGVLGAAGGILSHI